MAAFDDGYHDRKQHGRAAVEKRRTPRAGVAREREPRPGVVVGGPGLSAAPGKTHKWSGNRVVDYSRLSAITMHDSCKTTLTTG